MNIDEMVDAACERAGSDDFGADTWREGLEVLVPLARHRGGAQRDGRGRDDRSDRRQPGQPARGRAVVRPTPRDRRPGDRRPACSGSACPAPGRRRSSFLLAQDPARRSLRTWEAGHPCPPPETATEHTDPRIAEAQAGIDFTNEMFPGFEGMIPTAATGPQECLVLMAHDFRSTIFEGMARIPSYERLAPRSATWSRPTATTGGC